MKAFVCYKKDLFTFSFPQKQTKKGDSLRTVRSQFRGHQRTLLTQRSLLNCSLEATSTRCSHCPESGSIH